MKNKLNKKKKKSSDSVFDRNANEMTLENYAIFNVLRNSQEEKLLSLDIGRECGRSANT
jgi:hypothetical protein